MNLAILREPVVRIPTPEQVYLEYPLAGFGRRALAALIDHLLIFVAQFILVLFFIFLLAFLGAFSASYDESLAGWFLALTIAMLIGVIVGPLFYFILFEYYWRGQTPGKKVANIQVMRASGLALDRTSAVLRNLFRLVDWLPNSYFVGIWSMMLTAHQRRLGDLVAGTIIVALPRKHGVREVSAGTQSLGTSSTVTALFSGGRGEDLSWLINSYLRRRERIEPEARARILKGLAEKAGLEPGGDIAALERELYQRITS